MKNELHYIFSGKSKVSHGATIQAVTSHLERSLGPGEMVKDEKQIKREETTLLKQYASNNNLWIDNIDTSKYVSQGAEQKVYLADNKFVYKLNDSIYYTFWQDYFCNLLLHNYFFPDTAYQLIGFTNIDNVFYAVVKQPYIRATEPTDLELVNIFLESNGFRNTRNHDYMNDELGIILEDLHDENVLCNKGTLYFIDTVFYMVDDFIGKRM